MIVSTEDLERSMLISPTGFSCSEDRRNHQNRSSKNIACTNCDCNHNILSSNSTISLGFTRSLNRSERSEPRKTRATLCVDDAPQRRLLHEWLETSACNASFNGSPARKRETCRSQVARDADR